MAQPSWPFAAAHFPVFAKLPLTLVTNTPVDIEHQLISTRRFARFGVLIR
jgi:hypothetical protein